MSPLVDDMDHSEMLLALGIQEFPERGTPKYDALMKWASAQKANVVEGCHDRFPDALRGPKHQGPLAECRALEPRGSVFKDWNLQKILLPPTVHQYPHRNLRHDLGVAREERGRCEKSAL